MRYDQPRLVWTSLPITHQRFSSERGGKGDCVKEGGGEEVECKRERAMGVRLHRSPEY